MTRQDIDREQAESRLNRPHKTIHVHYIGVDMANKPDMVSFAVVGPKGVQMIIDRTILNAKRASRKADREYIANTLICLMERHGAEVERHDDGPNPGYHGASIALRFKLNGVGAMVDIDDLFAGGSWTLIDWHNTEYPVRNFTARFCGMIGDMRRATGCTRPHHKTTSQPADWYSLAMFLDAGLCLAARGEAFEPIAA